MVGGKSLVMVVLATSLICSFETSRLWDFQVLVAQVPVVSGTYGFPCFSLCSTSKGFTGATEQIW